MAAPIGNQNAAAFGARWSETLARRGVRQRRWPAGCRYIDSECRRFANLLATEVIRVHGSLSLVHAMALDSAVGWHAHGCYLAKLLRDGVGELKVMDKATLSEQAAKSKDRRAAAVARLELGGPVEVDPFDSLVVDEGESEDSAAVP